MAQPFLDDFTEASNTNLEDHTPSGGTAWTLGGGAAGAAVAQGTFNTLRTRSGTASYYTCDDQGSADHYAEAKLKNLSTLFPNSYLACRLADASNFIGWRCFGTGSSGSRLTKMVAGVATDLITHQGVDETIYRVEVSGSTAKLFAGGVQVGTDRTYSENTTETSQGIRIGSDATIDWLDDFEAGALGGGGTTHNLEAAAAAAAAASGDVSVQTSHALEADAAAVASATGSMTGGTSPLGVDAHSYATGSGSAAKEWTHTPVGTPAGVVVLVQVNSAELDAATAVTYGGVSMTELANSPAHGVHTAEAMTISAFFLGADVPAGPQTVSVSVPSNIANTFLCSAVTLTGTGDLEVQGTAVLSQLDSGVDNPSATLSLSSETCLVIESVFSGQGDASLIAPRSGWSELLEYDYGSAMGGVYVYDTIGSVDVTFGLDMATDEADAFAIAIKQVSAGAALAGDAAASAAATAALSVSVPLAAAGLAVATAAGAMSVSIPLAGTAVGEASASGDLSTTGTADLAAAATATANASGGLSLSIPLAASAVAQALAAAGLTQGVPIAGYAAGQAGASGALSAGKPLAGDAAAVAAAGAALTLNISLAGTAIAEAAAGAGLTVLGESSLAGDATASASASASLSHAVPLSGASLAVSSASGNLTQLVPLSGSAASASMATGGLDVSVQLSAAALAQALASAGLTVDGGMSAAAAAEAAAGGTITLRVNLDGAAVAQAIASGALTASGLIVSGTPGWVVAMPARNWNVDQPARNWSVTS